MPKFFYITRDKRGKKMVGVEEATTVDEAMSHLQARGLVVVNINPAGEIAKIEGLSKQVKQGGAYRRMHTGIRSDDLVLMARQMATLLGAGVTILKSLDIIAQQISSRRLFSVVKRLVRDMEAGLSLHESMAKHPRVFSDLWVNLVESGEASGNLALVLSRLATYLEKRAEFNRKIVSALLYPLILVIVATGALTFLTVWVIPKFQELFTGLHTQLPVLTQMIFAASVFARKSILFVLVGGVILVYLLRKYIQTEAGRRKWEQFKFKLPIFGEFFQVMVVEKFASEMSTLIESGVPILYALEITERSVNNRTMSDIIRIVKEDVRNGKPLSLPLERSGFFAPMVVGV